MSEIEHLVKTLPIDENLQAEVKKLEQDGWQLSPGTAPVAVYHLMRIKPQPVTMGVGQIHVDDSKVAIIRDGKAIN